VIPPLQRIQKERPATVALSLTSRNSRKTSYEIMYFAHIETEAALKDYGSHFASLLAE